MSTEASSAKSSPQVMAISKELADAELRIKTADLKRYEEIIWKIRAGYITILYGSLTFLVGKEGLASNLHYWPGDVPASATVGFLILGITLGAGALDSAYTRKKLRVAIVRDDLLEIAYDPECRLKNQFAKLRHLLPERPLRRLSSRHRRIYKERLRWSILWVLLPIYLPTPALAVTVYALFQWWDSRTWAHWGL